MIPKLEPKKELVVDAYYPEQRTIYFYSSPDAATEVEQFGTVARLEVRKDWHLLQVDGRYDFDDVLSWLNDFGQEEE